MSTQPDPEAPTGSVRRLSNRSRGRAASEALLREAALRLLDRNGVLAGLSLQDVADEAGVSRGLVHAYFGTRQDLLRSALDARLQEYADTAQEHRSDPTAILIRRTFRAAVREPHYAMVMALLAVDGDEDFTALPWIDDALTDVRAEIAKQSIADHDAEALGALVNAVAYGWGLFREAFARQLGVPVAELDRRVEQVWMTMVTALLAGELDA